MLFALFSAKLNSLEEVRFIRRGLSVANVVAENFAVPVFFRRGFPGDLQCLLIDRFDFDTARRAARCLKSAKCKALQMAQFRQKLN